jgi:hypothetical protein
MWDRHFYSRGHGRPPLIGALLLIELVLTRPVEQLTCAMSAYRWLGLVQPLIIIDGQPSPLCVEEIGTMMTYPTYAWLEAQRHRSKNI